MTIRVKQVAHVCIFAHDLEATRRFYEEALGLDVAFRFLRDGEVIGFYLNAGGRSHIEVFERQETRFDETDQINHLCLEVESIDAALAHLAAQGVEPTRPKKQGVDGTWQCWLADPNGVKIELFEYTDRSAQFTGGDRVVDW
jgi:lactoylglutathione lyase/glyoxylase I family protein